MGLIKAGGLNKVRSLSGAKEKKLTSLRNVDENRCPTIDTLELTSLGL
jgi:hypothetical protein